MVPIQSGIDLVCSRDNLEYKTGNAVDGEAKITLWSVNVVLDGIGFHFGYQGNRPILTATEVSKEPPTKVIVMINVQFI
jgi:hypothetical protein